MYFHALGRLFPFVQALVGAERFSAGVTGVGSGSTNAFAMTEGGGVDFTLTQVKKGMSAGLRLAGQKWNTMPAETRG